ncbi:CoA-transferase subunit beta [Kineosporia sp. A_224]|uniref:CoA-transferase subunit beta n=1 Tax=Kineosporia sp. A_224 TaxID=1962180 RepID=UPI000B4BBAA0|nr:CoA-transferase [Kineosporia sp. A_224]
MSTQTRTGTQGWSLDEWFVVALARTVADGEVVFHGFASPCAQVAMHVARRTHAPGSMLVEGATYAVNPEPAFVPPTSNDLALHRDAVYRMRFEEFFDAACRGAVDRMFLSGGQIDAYGNTNVTAIGGMPLPKIKLGGGGGGANISATIGALTVWTTRHGSGRTLVEAVDFLTDLGHRTPAGTRAELGHTGGGPQWLVTELGVLDYTADGRARLVATFPDVTVAEVEKATGFALTVADEVGTVAEPTPAELAAVRAVDPLGVRRLEFGPADLARHFGPAA